MRGPLLCENEFFHFFNFKERLPGRRSRRSSAFHGQPQTHFGTSRGFSEYINGLIRQYIPKGSNFDDIKELYIKIFRIFKR